MNNLVGVGKLCPVITGSATINGQPMIISNPCLKDKCEWYVQSEKICIVWKILFLLTNKQNEQTE